jgi:hypothetical protein
MKAKQESEENAVLDRLVKEWVVQEPLPLRFQEQVWARIERAEVEPEPSFWSLVARTLAAALERPKVACSYVSLLLVIGIAFGVWEAQRQNSELEASLGSRYLQSVDPFQPAPSHR